MARVIANQLSDASPGERRALETFRLAFMDEPDSIIWLEPATISPRTDLLVWSHFCGLLVIEVKDWSAENILQTSETLWQIRQFEEPKQNPSLQARKAQLAVKNRLSRNPELVRDGKLMFAVNYFVAFPNMDRRDFDDCPCPLRPTLADDCGLLLKEEVDADCSTPEYRQAFRQMIRNKRRAKMLTTLPREAYSTLEQTISPVFRRPDAPLADAFSRETGAARSFSGDPRRPPPFVSPSQQQRYFVRGIRLPWWVYPALLLIFLVGAFAWLSEAPSKADFNRAPILGLTATAYLVRPGNRVELQWDTSGYARVKLDDREVKPQGHVVLRPVVTAKHLLVGVTNAGRVDSADVTIEVGRAK